MKTTLHCFAAVLAAAIAVSNTHAANITWDTAQNITADTDISLNGSLVRAANLTPLNGNTTAAASTFLENLNVNLTLNGVTFVASPRTNATILNPMILENGDVLTPSDGSRVGPSTAANQFQGFGGPNATRDTLATFNTLTADYQRLLSTCYWNDGDRLNPTTTAMYTMTLNNLTIGSQYLFQAWVNDSRLNNLGMNNPDLYTRFSADSFVTYADVQHNVDNALGGKGQFVIGTFTADAISQVLAFAGGNTAVDIDTTSCTAVLNAYQLRDITPVPEPSTLGLVGLGLAALMLYRRRP